VWLLAGFFLRALDYPNDHFKKIEEAVDMDKLADRCYQEFEEAYGERQCVYNVHMTFAHLLQYRRLFGPPHTYCTDPFEGLYGLCDKCYANGTLSTPKQVMQVYIHSDLYTHKCYPNQYLRVADKNSLRTDDTLVMAKESIYKVIAVVDPDEKFLGVKCKLDKFNTDAYGVKDLDWNLVGVYSFDGWDKKAIVIKREEIKGKALQIGGDEGLTMVEVPQYWVKR
jgi:hypothetical protein